METETPTSQCNTTNAIANPPKEDPSSVLNSSTAHIIVNYSGWPKDVCLGAGLVFTLTHTKPRSI